MAFKATYYGCRKKHLNALRAFDCTFQGRKIHGPLPLLHHPRPKIMARDDETNGISWPGQHFWGTSECINCYHAGTLCYLAGTLIGEVSDSVSVNSP